MPAITAPYSKEASVSDDKRYEILYVEAFGIVDILVLKSEQSLLNIFGLKRAYDYYVLEPTAVQ